MIKMICKQLFLSVVTKHFNWEISAKNLLDVKSWEGLRMKNFNIMGVHWKIQFLGWFHENPIYRGEFPKGGGGSCTVCMFKSGLDKEEGVFLTGDWYLNIHYDFSTRK